MRRTVHQQLQIGSEWGVGGCIGGMPLYSPVLRLLNTVNSLACF